MSLTTESTRMTPPGSMPGLQILVVEDQADCAESTSRLLRIYGHDVEICRDGISALDKVQSHVYDVIILDIGLPGMDGWEVAKRMRGYAWQKWPFLIAMTGYGQEIDRQRSEDSGIDLHLTKPVNPEELRVLLTKFQTVIKPEDDL
jgi:CheY-like chemotaxis protein